MILLLLSLLLAQANQGTIAGRVVDSSGQGFADVEVLLVGPLTGSAVNAAARNPLMIQEIAEGSNTPLVRVTTQPDGSFRFPDRSSGSYMLKAQKAGYFAAVPLNGKYSTMLTTPVRLGVNATVDIRLTLIKDGTISGRVSDASGKPLADALVLSYQVGYDNNGRETLAEVASRVTNDRGEYRFYGQAPGEYYIAVAATASEQRLTGLARAFGHDWCCKTYYPSVPDARSAQPVKLTGGEEIAGKDIQLLARTTFKVSGRIVNGLSDPAASRSIPSISLVPANADALRDKTEFYSSSSIEADGSFKLEGVPPGSYDLIASVATGGSSYRGQSRVEVGSRDVDSVSVPIRPGAVVTVRLFVDGKQDSAVANPPRAGASAGGVRVELRPRSGNPAGSTAAAVDENGALVFSNVPPGVYSVLLSFGLGDTYVADIQSGGVSVYDKGFVVGDRSLGPIDVMFVNGAQSIRGIVRKADGTSAPSSTVVLVPEPARRQNPSLYQASPLDLNDGITFNGIAPGDYKVFAFESLPGTAYLNAKFLAKYESFGSAVHVPAEGNSALQFTVIPFELSR